MINVHIRASGKFREIEARGHAEFAPAGQDIVCSAFSMLIYALLDYLERNKKSAAVYKDTVRDGNVCLSFAVYDEKAITAFDVAIGGMKILAEQYPGNISIQGNLP